MAEDKRIDAHVVEHEGNVVLIMSPFVARVLHELSGQVTVSSDHPVRQATDKVWHIFDSLDRLDSDDFILTGNVSLLDDET